MIPLLGFTPDIDPTTPGAMIDCTNLIPVEDGLTGAPNTVNAAGVPAVAAEVRGSAVITLLNGNRRVFAGTQTKMYELSGGSWADVSRGGNYTGSTENRWSITQFGNATIATNDTEVIQASVSSGAFSDISGSPKARIVIAVGGFVIAFNINDAWGDFPDAWWCCALQDHTSWAPSVTTQANRGRLIGEGGEITAAARLGQQAVAFKAKAIFLGTYVGSPVVWQWDQVPGDVGCIGPEAVCDVGGTLIFRGEDDFYIYDGTRPEPIGAAVRQWFNSNSSQTYRYRTQAVFDRQEHRVWFFFPSVGSSGQADRALVYHLKTKQWGCADRPIEAALNYVAPGLTFDSVGSSYSTWDDLPNIPYDSQIWFPGGRLFSVFNTSHQLVHLTGSSVSSGFSTGWWGDDFGASTVQGVRVRFLDPPDSGSIQGFTTPVIGANQQRIGGGGTLNDGKFDILQDDRWHKFSFSMTGPVRLNAYKPIAVRSGSR